MYAYWCFIFRIRHIYQTHLQSLIFDVCDVMFTQTYYTYIVHTYIVCIFRWFFPSLIHSFPSKNRGHSYFESFFLVPSHFLRQIPFFLLMFWILVCNLANFILLCLKNTQKRWTYIENIFLLLLQLATAFRITITATTLTFPFLLKHNVAHVYIWWCIVTFFSAMHHIIFTYT